MADSNDRSYAIAGVIVGCGLVIFLLSLYLTGNNHGKSRETNSVNTAYDDNPQLQAERLAFITKMEQAGIFYKVAQPGDVPHIWVLPKFQSLTFDDKTAAVIIVARAYRADFVRLRDAHTGNDVGAYSHATGLSLE